MADENLEVKWEIKFCETYISQKANKKKREIIII